MRAIEAKSFGGPEVLAPIEAPDSAPGPGEAVVAVSVIPLLFVETQIRRGWGGEWFPVKPPYVPGAGVGGHVISVGDGIDPEWLGRTVVADTKDGGGYAEQVIVREDVLIAVPDGVSLAEAAALLHDGVTALSLTDSASISPRDWVLVLSAASGMGVILVQLARAQGAHVIAAARGDAKLELARQQGADVVVDYSDSGWAERVREATGGRGADVVFDGAGGEIGRAAFAVTADDGRFSAHGAPSGAFADISRDEADRRGITLRGITDVQLSPEERKHLRARVLQEAAAGRIKPVIGQTFPLERAADAHAALESRNVVGKTLLLTGKDGRK